MKDGQAEQNPAGQGGPKMRGGSRCMWGRDCRGTVGTVTVHKGHREHPVERWSSELFFALQKASWGCEDMEGLHDC